tara:strand:- start:17 stop:508 length:492 start_codon:yes stop_codon:yes gene_type:complete
MIFVAIGSNLNSSKAEEPTTNCNNAVKLLKQNFYIENISSWYKSEPIPKSDQPWYVNGVVKLHTNINPFSLLKLLLKVEKDFGRKRKFRNEARILDLDIISYKNFIFRSDILVLPHPRMHERSFVLDPLKEIEPKWVHPVFKMDILKLKQKFVTNQRVYKIKK